MKNYVKEHRGYRVPEGATHWQPEGRGCPERFIKYEGDKPMYWNAKGGGFWRTLSGGVSPFIHELPTASQEWDGEGLPPVGAECEISYEGHIWNKCFINYSSEDIVVFAYESGAERACSTEDIVRFRPIKTQEQKDREAFIDDCLKATAGNEPHKIFYDLYEAGARFK